MQTILSLDQALAVIAELRKQNPELQKQFVERLHSVAETLRKRGHDAVAYVLITLRAR